MADLSIDPLHRSHPHHPHHHPSSIPPTDPSAPSSHHPSISRVRQFSLGADSASTVTTTTSSTSSSISTTVSTVEKEGKGLEEPKGDTQSSLPPPSVFELTDDNQEQETEQEEGEDQAIDLIDPIDPQEDSSSTPRLVTPTPTPTTEKFDPLAFLTRPAGDHSYSHSYSHHQNPAIADTEPRSNGHQKVYNGQKQTDTDTETQDRGQQTAPQPSSFLELPDPAKYAADLDAERWSLTPDGSRHDGNNDNDNDNANQRQEGSVYFTAAAVSPKDAPSSVKSEPSFSPDRVRSLSPGYSRAKTNDPNSNSNSNSNNYSQDDLAADTANPSKEATDLFVRRLRESIWKSVGKAPRSNNNGSLSVGGQHTGNGNGKNPSTFTQDWLAQFLTGVPRTERTNWLSDDESSSSAASEREVKGGNTRKSRGVGFECLDSEGEATDTTRSYTTAVNRVKTNTVEGEGDGNENGKEDGEDDDWLGLEDESIAEVLELDEKEEEEEEGDRSKDSRKENEKEEAIAAADNVARDFDLDVGGEGEGEGDLSTPRAATFADAAAAKATDTTTATAKRDQDDFWDLGLDDDDDGEQKITEVEPSKDATENVHEKQHANNEEEHNNDQNNMASADVQHLHPPEQQHLNIGLSMDPKQEDLTLTQTQTTNHNHQPNSSSAELPLSPPQQPVSPRPAASKRDSSDKPLPPPPPPPKEVPPKEERKQDGRVNGAERKQGTSPVPAHAHAQTQGLLQPTPGAAKQSPPTRSPTPAPPSANPSKPAPTTGNAPFARPKKRVMWRKRACIIALPLEEPRTHLLTPKQVEERLANFEAEGYSVRGWDAAPAAGNEHDGDGAAAAGSLSRPMFPDPAECKREWEGVKEVVKNNGKDGAEGEKKPVLPVQFPDQRVWDAYVQELQEEKLRALGVDLGGPPPAAQQPQPQSPVAPPSAPPSLPHEALSMPSESPMANGNLPVSNGNAFLPAISPPLPTGSAASNPAFGLVNPFTSMPFAGTPVNGPAFLPFQPAATTPLGPHTPFAAAAAAAAAMTPHAHAHPQHSADPMAAAMFGNATPFQPTPFGAGMPGQQSYFPPQQGPPPQGHAQSQAQGQGQGQQDEGFAPEDGPSDEVEINVNGVAHGPEVELAHPLPSRHRHNVSDTLQKGVEEAEYYPHGHGHGQSASASHFKNASAGTANNATANANGYQDASDIDTNPSLNGDEPRNAHPPHHLGQGSNHSVQPPYTANPGFNPAAPAAPPAGFAFDNENVFANNGSIPSHQGHGSQGFQPGFAPFSPELSPGHHARGFMLDGGGGLSPPVQWNADFGFAGPGAGAGAVQPPAAVQHPQYNPDAPSFNIDAPAFTPGGGSGSMLAPSGGGEPWFQPPPRRKSKAIPIKKPEEKEAPPVPALPRDGKADGNANGNGKEVKSPAVREAIRDSGVALNTVRVQDEDGKEEKEKQDGKGGQQQNGNNKPLPEIRDEQVDSNADADKEKRNSTGLKPTAKPFEFKPFTATAAAPAVVAPAPEQKHAPSPVANLKDDRGNQSTDIEDIDAAMTQLNGNGLDISVQRTKSPGDANAATNTQDPEARGRHQDHPAPPTSTRDATASRSPAPTALKVPTNGGTSRASSQAPPTTSATPSVRKLNNPPSVAGDHVSDYSDALLPGEEDKLRTRTRFFDTHVNAIVGHVIDSKLGPLERTLDTIQAAVHMISSQKKSAGGSSRPGSHGRSLSIEVESSDADDEDEEVGSTPLRSRSPLSRKEARKADKIRQAVLDAMAAHMNGQQQQQQQQQQPAVNQSPPLDLSEIQSTLAELRELAAKKPELAETAVPKDPVDLKKMVADALMEHAAALQERPKTSDSATAVEEQLTMQLESLKNMLRVADERAEKEFRMRRDAQDSLAECHRLLKFSEEDGNKQRDLAEKYEAELKELKETFVPEAEKIKAENTRLRDEQRNVQWTLSELSEKNITLVGRLDEFTVASDHWKSQTEKAKAENNDLRQTISTLKSQMEENVQARTNLRSKYDKLQEDMIAATQEIARERAAWKAREEELSLGNSTLKALYNNETRLREKMEMAVRDMESVKAAHQREVRLREKLEQDIVDLEAQEKESSKFRVMLSQSQRENSHLNHVVAQLRQETHSCHKELARLSREKEDAKSRSDRLADELNDAKENQKSEMVRMAHKMQELKAKAWQEAEQLRLNLADAKTNNKAEMERLFRENDELELRRQEEVERIGRELSELQQKSAATIARLQHELRFVNKSKQQEIDRLKVEVEEALRAKRRETERRETQLHAMFTKDQAKIDALKQDLEDSETLRRIDMYNMQREMNELSTAKVLLQQELDDHVEQLKRFKSEVQSKSDESKGNVSGEAIESVNAQFSQLRSDHEKGIAELQEELRAVKAEHLSELEAAHEQHMAALETVADSHQEQFSRERSQHEKNMNDLRERHARALHNVTEDRQRYELHLAEMTRLKDEKMTHIQERNQFLQDKVQHLEEKLEIAKSAAQAAAQAAQSARGSAGSASASPVNLPTQSSPPPQPSLSYAKETGEPEKISPQALRESIMVLQDQLQQREQRIEELETHISTFDKDAPNKLKEKDTEIGWLRELLGVRVDDLQDIITTLSKQQFDPNAVRDAAIRLKANLEMEQQEKERAMAGGKRVFPSLESIANLASLANTPKSLPLAAAAAWGNWRKRGQATESSGTTAATGNGDSNAEATSTPSRAASTAQSFLSGLLTPPSSGPRRGRSATPFRATGARTSGSATGNPSARRGRTFSNASTDSAPAVPQRSAFHAAVRRGAEEEAIAEEEQDAAESETSMMTTTASEATVTEEAQGAQQQRRREENEEKANMRLPPRLRTPLFKPSSYDHDAPDTLFGDDLFLLAAGDGEEEREGEEEKEGRGQQPLQMQMQVPKPIESESEYERERERDGDADADAESVMSSMMSPGSQRGAVAAPTLTARDEPFGPSTP